MKKAYTEKEVTQILKEVNEYNKETSGALPFKKADFCSIDIINKIKQKQLFKTHYPKWEGCLEGCPFCIVNLIELWEKGKYKSIKCFLF